MPVGDFLWCDSDKMKQRVTNGVFRIDCFYAKGDHQKREKKIVSSYRVCRLTLFEFRRVDIALIESNHEKKKEVREANRHAASGMGHSVGIVICTSQR